MNIAVTLVLVLLLGDLVAQDFVLDCEEHCPQCKDDVEENCTGDFVLIVDGDACKCCDQCGYKRGFQEVCTDQVAVTKLEDEVHAKVVPVQCEHGYECYSGVCVSSELGFCSAILSGRSYVYSCDVEGNFLPIKCSNYHCWCVNPISGVRLTKTKVRSPMDSANVSYCYYLMTVNGLLDILVPSPKLKTDEPIVASENQRNEPKNMYQRIIDQTLNYVPKSDKDPCDENEDKTVFHKLSKKTEFCRKGTKHFVTKEKTSRVIKRTIRNIMTCNGGPKAWQLDALARIKRLEIKKAKIILNTFTNNSIDFPGISNRTVKLKSGTNVMETFSAIEDKWTHLLFEIIRYMEKYMPQNTTDINFGAQKIGRKLDRYKTDKFNPCSFDNGTSEINNCTFYNKTKGNLTLNMTKRTKRCQQCYTYNTHSENIKQVKLNKTLQKSIDHSNYSVLDLVNMTNNRLPDLKPRRLFGIRPRYVNSFRVWILDRRNRCPFNIRKMGDKPKTIQRFLVTNETNRRHVLRHKHKPNLRMEPTYCVQNKNKISEEKIPDKLVVTEKPANDEENVIANPLNKK